MTSSKLVAANAAIALLAAVTTAAAQPVTVVENVSVVDASAAVPVQVGTIVVRSGPIVEIAPRVKRPAFSTRGVTSRGTKRFLSSGRPRRILKTAGNAAG